MNCNGTKALLSELVDGELPDDARSDVLAHLATCEACAAEYRKLHRTVRFVRANANRPIRSAWAKAEEEFLRALVDDDYDGDPMQLLIESAASVFATPPEQQR